MNDTPLSDFEKAGSSSERATFLGDFVDFLRCNKKWWLLPILAVLLLFGLLMLLSGSAAAPFIYTFF